MKRSNKILFTICGVVLFILLVVNVVIAFAGEETKSSPVQVVMENYFAIGNMLSQDSFKRVDKNAQNIVEATSQILKEEKQSREENKEYFSQIKAIQTAAQKFEAKDLKSARESYKALSQAVEKFVKTFGYSGSAYSFYCPMVKENWFHSTEQVANPFYGTQMLKCGKMTGKVMEGKYVEKTKDMPAGHQH